MKKKLVTVLLCVVTTLCLAFGFTACNKDNSGPDPAGTPGLAYELSEDGKSYICTGMGTATATDIVIASVYNGKPVTEIGDFAFSKVGYDTEKEEWDEAFNNPLPITSVVIPDSITKIGLGAFSVCIKLTSVTIGGGVTDIESGAFSYCHGLTSIVIPNSVKSIGETAFDSCSGLTSVTIGSGVTSIGDYAFVECYKLVEIYNLSSLNLNNYAKNVYTPTSGESKLSTTTDGFIFYDGGEGERYLMGYTGTQTNLTLPANCNGNSYEIYQYLFFGPSNFTSITIPNNVTGIGKDAFGGCEGLTSVTIGNGMASIAGYAFNGCAELTSITFNGTKAQWNAISKERDWDYETGNYTVHCTDGDIAKS